MLNAKRFNFLSCSIRQIDLLSFISVFGCLVFFILGLTYAVYPLLALISFLWLHSFSKQDFFFLTLIIFIVFVLFIVNVFFNYIDLALKGSVKLFLFALASLSFRRFFYVALCSNIAFLRVIFWSVFLFSLLVNSGIDLRSMQQMMLISLLFMVELCSYIKGGRGVGLFYLVSFVLLVTTKKQLWFSALFFIVFVQPDLIKRFLVILALSLLFVSFFGLLGSADNVTLEKRSSSFFSERFITPDPYGNMRLYLTVTLIPKLIEDHPWFGYGLERYGSVEAYKTGRDIESNELGIGEFTGIYYRGETDFGSVAADVGFLTVAMQMGLIGLIFYLMVMRVQGGDTLNFLKGFVVVLPYFFGGPIIYSVGFPLLSGMVYGALFFKNNSAHTVEK